MTIIIENAKCKHMQWFGRRESSNVDDRRGFSGGGIATGGGIIGVIIYLVYSFLSGNSVDSSQIPQISPQSANSTLSPEEQKEDDKRASFVKVVLADTEDIWAELFKESGATYTDPTLVLYRDQVASACGGASAASGPFYCPNDSKLYVDLSFYQEMQTRLNAPGDFAMAYVIAHEVGHHVQNLSGTAQKISRLRQQANEKDANRYSVMLELQADFYAGVWAHYEQKKNNILDKGDIEEALNAANAIGDDRLQKRSSGVVVPDAFTHGTSAQRMYWFKKGYDTGDMKQGDTFNDPNL
ncbi:MAG TPA: neutral zinc metallopeptidase [Chitinophagaceae bacterium]|nr:neutral zinc metallopeptidase [Chitinophagaceae bacterium]